MLIEDKIRAICMPDSHAGPDGLYLIRSLYFDSPDNMFYAQTRNGLDHRYKYRIRIYDKSDSRITLERKESLHGKKHKDISVIPGDLLEAVLEGRDYGSEDDLVSRFFLDRKLFLLEPRVIIEYSRAPYVYSIGNVRITFDKSIFASDSFDLFKNDLTGIDVLPGGHGILEVKYDDVLPGAIKKMFNSYDLQAVSFSKYVRAVDAMNGIVGEC